jgi:hypothetical protein
MLWNMKKYSFSSWLTMIGRTWFLVFLLQMSFRNAIVLGFVRNSGPWHVDRIRHMEPQSVSSMMLHEFHRDSLKIHSSETRSPSALLWKSRRPLHLIHYSSSREDAETSSPFSNLSVNVIPLVVWVGLIGLSFVNNGIVPHGLPVEQVDQEILQNIIQNPVHPANVNELYYTLFNVFGPLPLILSALILPQEELRGKTQRISPDSPFVPPPQPFLFGSAVLGYFVLGLYLALRPQLSVSPNNEVNSPDDVDWSWFTRNLWENRAFHAGILLFLCYLPFGSNVLSAINEQGWTMVYQDFQHLIATSRFATISCMDLFLLHMTSVSFIPSDYTLRSAYQMPTEADSNDILQARRKGSTLALLAALLPFFGPAVYIAFRPSLLAKK